MFKVVRCCVVGCINQGPCGVPTAIFRWALMSRVAGYVVTIAAVVSTVVVKERLYGEYEIRAESANPGEGGERIALAVGVAQDRGWIAGIIRHLIKIAARLSNQAKLVLRIQVEDERSKAAEAVGGVVLDRGGWSLQAEIGAVAAHAAVIGKTIGVAPEVDLIIGLIKVGGGEDERVFTVVLKAGARGGVEKHRFVRRGKAQLKMQNRRSRGQYRDALLVSHKVRLRDRDSVFTKGDRIKVKLPSVVRADILSKLR